MAAPEKKGVTSTGTVDKDTLATLAPADIDWSRVDCHHIPTSPEPVPAALLQRCGARSPSSPTEDLAVLVQRGPIILEDATSVTINTSSVPTITTLSGIL